VPEKEQLHNDDEEEEDWRSWRVGDDATLKDDDLRDISEEDCSAEFLKKQGYFKHFEENGTFDWSFHSNYLDCAHLSDYHRLVLTNYVSYAEALT
jgi:hypothetical protein